MAKVVWIVGSSYSGSSLLNLLLDTQPTIRGIGEGGQVYFRSPDPNSEYRQLAGGPCAACKSTVRDCRLYGKFQGDEFYRFAFDAYGCDVLVDSSKSLRILTSKPFEPSYNYYAAVISKAPHEAAYSCVSHAKWDHWDANARRWSDVHTCFRMYVNAYQERLRDLRLFSRSIRTRSVPYRAMACFPIEMVQELSDWLEQPFDSARLTGAWWETDTHVLGGNPAIVAQVTADESFSFAVPPAKYLDGKYADKQGRIFWDQAWTSDPSFAVDCLAAYAKLRSELKDLLPQLGYDYDAVVAEVEAVK